MAVQGPNNATALTGTSGSMEIVAWGQGHQYSPTGPAVFQGIIPVFFRPKGLSSGDLYYQRSKSSYGTIPRSQFLSTRTSGVNCNGIVDDTAVLQKAINVAFFSGQIVFFDAGTYRVTKLLYVPRNSKLVGESYSVIISSRPLFADVNQSEACGTGRAAWRVR